MRSDPSPGTQPSGRPCRVLVVPQTTYAFGKGGLEVQQDQTIEALQRRGVSVLRYTPWLTELDVDVVHIFGSEVNNADLAKRVKMRGIPLVITSMFMPIRPPWQYGLFAKASSLIPANTVTLRNRMLHDADGVIAISQQEKRDLHSAFGIGNSRIAVLPNGIEERFFDPDPSPFTDRFGIRDFVLCVASIEPRKNQIRVANALRELDTPVVFIGPVGSDGSIGTKEYVREFSELVAANDSVHWIPALDHSDPLLASAYAAARVHVLASTVEAQGLVTLEAVASGAQAVVSDLPQIRELFTSDVIFADPTSEGSIRASVTEALSKPRMAWGRAEERPQWLMSWDAVAEHLELIYRGVISAAGASV